MPSSNRFLTASNCSIPRVALQASVDVWSKGRQIGGLFECVSDSAQLWFGKVPSYKLDCKRQSFAVLAARYRYAWRPAEIIRYREPTPMRVVQ